MTTGVGVLAVAQVKSYPCAYKVFKYISFYQKLHVQAVVAIAAFTVLSTWLRLSLALQQP